jgi:peptidoglycan hydrolase-like protein with peptidoglycan-binding domain
VYEAACSQQKTTSSMNTSFVFTRNLKIGDMGEDVRALQKILNSRGYLVAAKGAGSKGSESAIFGPATAHALSEFQEANAATILTPFGLTKGTGVFGESTRKFMSGS